MSQEQFYRIEAYLRGEMPPAEKATFEAELAADPALAEQVAAQQALRKVGELLVEDELRAEISKWKTALENEPVQPPAPGKNVRLRWWGIIGIAALLLVLLFFLIPKDKERDSPIPPPPIPDSTVVREDPPTNTRPPDTSSAQKRPQASNQTRKPPALTANADLDLSPPYREMLQPLIAEALKTVQFVVNGASRNADSTGQWFKTAKELFDQKQYGPAITYLKKIQPDDQYYMEAQYNIGSIYFAEGNYTDATPHLRLAASNTVENFLYADEARWYLTLSLMKTGGIEEAEKQIADLLKNPSGDFSNEAKALRVGIAEVQKRFPPTAPIAQADPANFSPDDRMEGYLGNVRGGAATLKVGSPLNGADFAPDKKGEALVRFAGTIEGASEGAPGVYVIKIFNNKDTDTPQVSWPLELKKDADGLRFDVSQPLRFPPGLYYFTVEQASERLYVGKFTIGKPVRK